MILGPPLRGTYSCTLRSKSVIHGETIALTSNLSKKDKSMTLEITSYVIIEDLRKDQKGSVRIIALFSTLVGSKQLSTKN